MRLIGAWSHAIIDYAIIVLLMAGPGFAGFSGRQADMAYVLAGCMFLLSVFTRYPLGIVRMIRFPLHGAVELLIIALLLILPWLANFARGIHSRNFYLFVGIIMLAVWVMTDFRRLRERSAGPEDAPK